MKEIKERIETIEKILVNHLAENHFNQVGGLYRAEKDIEELIKYWPLYSKKEIKK